MPKEISLPAATTKNSRSRMACTIMLKAPSAE
jgi:hypothetical protein